MKTKAKKKERPYRLTPPGKFVGIVGVPKMTTKQKKMLKDQGIFFEVVKEVVHIQRKNIESFMTILTQTR